MVNGVKRYASENQLDYNLLTNKPFYSTYDILEYLPEDTITTSYDEYYNMIYGSLAPLPYTFINGETFIVKLNDVEYECIACTSDYFPYPFLGNITLANIDARDSGEPFFIYSTEYEFIVCTTEAGTYNISVSFKKENITYLDSKYIEDMYYKKPIETVLLDNYTSEQYTDDNNNNNRPIINFVEGNIYKVIWDDVIYDNIIPNFSEWGNYISLDKGSSYLYIDDEKGEGIHVENEDPSFTFTLIEISYEIHPIDSKYIPDDIARVENENFTTTNKTLVGAINELNDNKVASPIKAKVGQTIVVKSVNENGFPIEWESIDGQIGREKLTLSDRSTGHEYYITVNNGVIELISKLAKIKITKLPDKTSYTDAYEFDPTGMTVIGESENGKEFEILDYTYDKYITPGDNTHAIKYKEFDVVYETTVPITTMSLEEALQDFTYTANSDGTYTITEWNGTLYGKPSTRMIVPNSELVIV